MASFVAGAAVGGRGGLAVASVYVTVTGTYCLLNFLQCREAHCGVTGPGFLLAALLGFAAALVPGSALSWYRTGPEAAVYLVVLAAGYALERAVAARAARRDQIIAAAACCFARSGYHATTMADVAEAAGVSKGTPYLYFPGKEALFITLYEEWDCGLAARVDAAVSGLAEPGRRSPRAILSVVAAAVAAHVTDNPQSCRVLMEATTLAAYEPAITAKVQAANALSLDQLTGLFAAGVAAGEWPAGSDPALQARLFTAGLYGLMAQWHLAPGAFSLEAAMKTLAGPAGAGGHDAGRQAKGAVT